MYYEVAFVLNVGETNLSLCLLTLQSRRVSFADPIQQQETADDIDRRSPAIRTSSPRRSKNCAIPQSKVNRPMGPYKIYTKLHLNNCFPLT